LKLRFYDHQPPNFGDDLNNIMWDDLLPQGFLDENQDELFIGIGSIISDEYPKEAIKHVIGSGVGGYAPPPTSHENWDFVWVRGPRTAKILGLDASKAICDAAVLLRFRQMKQPLAKTGPAFMPHFRSLDRGHWQRVCELANIMFLDPTRDAETLLAQMSSASVVISEAMHGCIVADTLRIPWIGVLPIHAKHAGKWYDWSDSLGMTLQPAPISPSSALELYVQRTGKQGMGGSAKFLGSKLFRPIDNILTERSAKKLSEIATQVEPTLSNEARFHSVSDQALERLASFVKTSSDQALRL